MSAMYSEKMHQCNNLRFCGGRGAKGIKHRNNDLKFYKWLSSLISKGIPLWFTASVSFLGINSTTGFQQIQRRHRFVRGKFINPSSRLLKKISARDKPGSIFPRRGFLLKIMLGE